MSIQRVVRGWCSACRSYDLRADDNGTVSCGSCGAADLLPTQEARDAAVNGPGLDPFAKRFRKEVKRGLR